MFEPIPAQGRVPHLPKRVITGLRLKINNSSNKIVILMNWRNPVHNSCMSSWFAWLFWKSAFSWISWFSWSETKCNHPRMTATTALAEDGKLKLAVIHFCIRKAGKENNVAERSRWPMSYHSLSDDLCGLNLFIYSHICKKETFLMLAAATLYIMYILNT